MNKVVLRAIQGFKDKRLSQSDVADLIFLWNEYESDIGIKAIDYSAVHVDGGEYVTDPLLPTLGATSRARRIRVRLTRIDPRHVRVLWMVYGYQNRFAPYGRLGDLSGLVDYTAAAIACSGREEIEKRLHDAEFERTVRMQAERLLWDASAAYRATR